MLPEGFSRLEEVNSNIQKSIRYSGSYNFTGGSVNGYNSEDTVIMTTQALNQLLKVQDDIEKDGYSLVIYDAYRPQKAVNHFVAWGEDENFRNKEIFYPNLTKKDIFQQGFINNQSTHSRGSTVDLTLINKGTIVLDSPKFYLKTLKNGRKIPFYDDNTIDMGGSFDLFDEISFPDNPEVTDQQYQMRVYLQNKMKIHGFYPIKQEWWHFVLENEPFPNQYFDFNVQK